jgi:LPS export ABC transporter protein LptC
LSPRRIAKLIAAFGTVALGAILVVTVLVVRHRAASQKIGATVAALLPGTLLHAHNFHWTQMKGDRSQWVLKATDANYSDDKTSLILVHPEISMKDKDGTKIDLSANSAQLKMIGSHIKSANLSGGLIMHYGNFVLDTSDASFDPDQDRIEATGLVTIKGPNLRVSGVGLIGHPNAQTFELQSQVTTNIQPRQQSETANRS